MWMFWVQGQICFQPCHFLKHNLSLFALPSIHFILTWHVLVDKKKFCALQLFTQECIDIKTHLLLLGVKMYLVWNKWHISAVSRHKPLWNKNFFFPCTESWCAHVFYNKQPQWSSPSDVYTGFYTANGTHSQLVATFLGKTCIWNMFSWDD